MAMQRALLLLWLAVAFVLLCCNIGQAHYIKIDHNEFRSSGYPRPPLPPPVDRLPGQHLYASKELTPAELLVDLTNDLAFRILHYHSILNRNNFAFSPSALMSVLVALYEGAAGRSATELRNVLQLPATNVIRVGYRDIHRRLRTYFFGSDNPLRGLSLNRDNVTITRDYEAILTFYGYDLGMDMVSSTAAPPASTTSTSTSTTVAPANTTSTSTTTSTTTTTMTTPAPKVTEDTTTTPTTTSSTTAPTTTAEMTTTTPTTTTTTTTTTTEAPTTTTTPSTPQAIETTTAATPTMEEMTPTTTTATTITDPTTITTSSSDEATPTAATPAPDAATVTTTTTEATPTTTTETNAEDETTTSVTTIENAEATTANANANVVEGDGGGGGGSEVGALVSTFVAAEDVSGEPLQRIQAARVTRLPPPSKLQAPPLPPTPRANYLPSVRRIAVKERRTGRQQRSKRHLLGNNNKELDASLFVALFDHHQQQQRHGGIYAATAAGGVHELNNEYTVELQPHAFTSSGAGVTGVGIASGGGGAFSAIGGMSGPSGDIEVKANLNTDVISHVFYLNHQQLIHTTFKVYNAVLYFKYFDHLKMSVLELELDTPNYNLMILLPDYHVDLVAAAASLRLGPTLRMMRKQLTAKWVQAIIPDFQLHGTMFLTNDLQNMGILDIFEPNRADFHPMTNENRIYVKHIEQSINVNIRTRPINQLKRAYGTQAQPIQISVSHPFLFFVIDRELDVAVMSGRILNPQNVRIQ